MSTLSRDTKTKPERTLFRSNPVLNKLSKITERTETNSATYAGIASKTTFFLLVTLVGMIVQLLVMNSQPDSLARYTFTVYEKFAASFTKNEAIILAAVVIVGFVCELIGIFVSRTIPVTGTVYSASQGYLISFLVFKVLNGYEYLGMEALLLTVGVVLVMSWLYTSGTIKVDNKFRTVLLTLVLGSVSVGLLTFVGSLIPATRPFVQAMMANKGLVIAMDVLGLVIAALFLISDFSMIDTCVKEGYPKKYEWAAAFGLVFTVIWIYLKILDLLMQFAGKDKK